jgi:LPS sulfotransferase NodH
MSESSASAAPCYAICALPRSGSWLLTLGLEDTTLAGRPRPYLCRLETSEPLPGQARMESVCAAFAALRRRQAGRNGVFGLKLESTDLPDLMAWARGDGSFAGTEMEFLSALLPGLRYVYLSRQDKTRGPLDGRGIQERARPMRRPGLAASSCVRWETMMRPWNPGSREGVPS